MSEYQKENRELWIEALRSGEFTQGVGALRNPDDTRCCLGVACDVYKRAMGIGKWMVDADEPGSRYFIVADYRGRHERGTGALPNVVREWLGLRTEDGSYQMREADGEFGHFSSLVTDNDTRHKTFAEIADIIEAGPMDFLADDDALEVAA